MQLGASFKRKRRGAYTASYGSTLRSISGSRGTRARRSSARTMSVLFISRACRAGAKATRISKKNCRLYAESVLYTFRWTFRFLVTFISQKTIFHLSIRPSTMDDLRCNFRFQKVLVNFERINETRTTGGQEFKNFIHLFSFVRSR